MVFNIKTEVLGRVYIVGAGLLLVGMLIVFRLFQLSVTDSARWKRKADEQYLRWKEAPRDRGNILADDGSLLATSLPFFDVHWDAKAEGITEEMFNASVDSLSMLLSTYIDQQFTPGAYREWLISQRMADKDARGVRYVPIAKRLSFVKMRQLKTFPLFRLGRHKGGLIVEQRPERERPYKMLAQRTIGYMREGALPVGLEGTFDKVLGGSEGKQLMLRVPGDMYIPINDLAEIEPKPGNDVVTTLDVNIQDVAENALMQTLKTHKADHGCAIVMEVKTGKIRAMANLGLTEQGDYWETFNYAVGERVEPGSMFKLASFMALLEDGHIDDLSKNIPVYKGKVKIYNEELQDSEPHGRDTMSIREVFARSSNVGTATLIQQAYGGNKSRQAAFVERLQEFGLMLPTEVEVGGEELPYLKNPNDTKSEWSGTTLPWMSIGYELLLTPLQLLQFYNAVANDGKMMKPYLVQRTEHYGQIVEEYKPRVLRRRIASDQTLRKAKELLGEVVKTGTAKNIFSQHVSMGGKTGTAQLNYHKLKSKGKVNYQAGFCGFFPLENPIYSCIVVVSGPQSGGYHGAEVAAPVFRAIAQNCFALKADMHTPINLAKAAPLVAAKLPAFDAGRREDLDAALDWLGIRYLNEPDAQTEWGVLRPQGRDSLLLLDRKISDKTVPSVIGMGLKDAIYLLENRGCRVRIQGVGKVRQQSIQPGTRANGQTCVLILE
jgi:cell division protein FtsI (penicillin-binding protein 3)